LRQAIRAGHKPTVRIILGTPPFQFGAKPFHDWFHAFVKEVGGDLPIQAASMSTHRQIVPPVPTSWDHSKVIAVDGRSAIVGGMNYWAKDYLQVADPANDVSMTVNGPAAAQVTRFENVVWGWTCANRHRSLYVDLKSSNIHVCHTHAGVLPAAAAGDVPILTLGRLGNGIEVPGEAGRESPPIPDPPVHGSACNAFQRQRSDTNTNREYEYRNPGETGLRALIASAKRSVFLSQQDLLSCVYHVEAYFDERVFAALGTKVADRVPITIVLSDEGAKSAGDGYSNGKPIKDVAHTLTKVVAAQQQISYSSARAMVCRDVGLAGIHNGPARTWPNRSPFANHAKVVSVDDSAFYIGSENLYPARLQEQGMIVESPAASDRLRASYLDPLWRWSRGYALIDPEGACGPF
jgi:phosphatidylserine/phosphatidylglycerophosphate/cardiolipin synthase-like enzyme